MASLGFHLFSSSVHEESKPFKCAICDTRFAENSDLNNHVGSVHEGNKSFKCVICDTRFAKKPELNTHVMSVHEVSKPFKCAICDSGFAENSDFVCIISILSTRATRYTYLIVLTP